MTDIDEQKIYSKAIELWGRQLQSDMMIEEASELIKAIIKYRRGQATIPMVMEELVDCQIMINQMKIVLKNNPLFDAYMKQKTNRLKNLIESDNNFNGW